MAATYGPLIYFDGHLLATSLGTFLHALLLWSALRVVQPDPSARSLFLLGLCWGLAVVVRPNAILLGGALGVAVLEVTRRETARVWLRSLAALGLGGALAIAPVTLRNAVTTGEAVLLTSHGGLNFYVGNGPGATGSWTIPDDVPGAHSPTSQFDVFREHAQQALGRPVSHAEADAYWYGRTVDTVLADPGRWTRLMLRKLHLFWNARELHNIYDYEFWRDIGFVLGWPLPQFGWIAPFGLVGMLWLLPRSPRERMVGLVAVLGCAVVVLAYVTDRHRLPYVPVLLVAGTALLAHLAGGWRRRSARSLVPLGSALVLAAAVAYPIPVNKRMHEKYGRLGDAWLDLGRLPYARWAYERSVDAKPTYLPAHRGLVRVYARSGDDDAAARSFSVVERLTRESGDPDAKRSAERLRQEVTPP